ncbi:MAG: ATP-grasp domain-containing protein [Sulfuritalea sp.]|nr:ATP-grasp domain-containing protein [Sulfuritalea sp.]
MPGIRVALTGLAGLDNPEPGLAVARALRKGWRGALQIEGLVYDPFSTGGWTPGVADQLHMIPPIAHGDEAVLQRLLELHKKYPIDALVPCLDLEVPIISRLSSRLARAGIRTLLPEVGDVQAISKANLSAFCYANEVATPRTEHVRDLSAVALHADNFGYPLWVKGTVAGAKKVFNREQAVFEAEILAAKWGGGVLLQEAIDGSEYMVAVVARGDGSCLAMASARKLGTNQRGKSVVGAVIADPVLKRVALRLLSRLHWRGPLELEFVRSANGGQFHLIEINCRFPAWILLTEFAGGNMPVALLREILSPGGRAPRTVRVGSMYVRDVQEMVVPIASVRQLRRSGSAQVPAGKTMRRKTGDLAVGVTGISAFELTQPGLGVARCLRNAPEVGRLLGLTYAPNDTGLFRSELFDVCRRISVENDEEKEHEGDAMLFDQLATIRKKSGLDVVIPNLDFEIGRFQRIAPELDRIGVRTLLPNASARRKLGKQALAELIGRHQWTGFEYPETMLIRSRSDLVRAWERLGSPLMLKGIFAGAARVFTLQQALVAWMRFKAEGDAQVLAQPSVFGEEFGVGLVCDRAGSMIGALPLKKLVMCERGKTWGAIPVALSQAVADLGDMMKKVGWVGPADVEFIRDSMTDRLELIEINPRFPAWVGFCGLIDVNLPRQAVLAAMARNPVPVGGTEDLAEGVIFMRTAEEIPAAASTMAALVNRGEIVYG